MRRAAELAVVAAFLGLAAFVGARLLRGRTSGAGSGSAPPPMVPARTDSADGESAPRRRPARSVTTLPRIKMSSPPRPARKGETDVPPPSSR